LFVTRTRFGVSPAPSFDEPSVTSRFFRASVPFFCRARRSLSPIPSSWRRSPPTSFLHMRRTLVLENRAPEIGPLTFSPLRARLARFSEVRGLRSSPIHIREFLDWPFSSLFLGSGHFFSSHGERCRSVVYVVTCPFQGRAPSIESGSDQDYLPFSAAPLPLCPSPPSVPRFYLFYWTLSPSNFVPLEVFWRQCFKLSRENCYWSVVSRAFFLLLSLWSDPFLASPVWSPPPSFPT